MIIIGELWLHDVLAGSAKPELIALDIGRGLGIVSAFGEALFRVSDPLSVSVPSVQDWGTEKR